MKVSDVKLSTFLANSPLAEKELIKQLDSKIQKIVGDINDRTGGLGHKIQRRVKAGKNGLKILSFSKLYGCKNTKHAQVAEGQDYSQDELEILRFSNLVEEIKNTNSNIFLEKESSGAISECSMTSLFSSGSEWQQALKDWDGNSRSFKALVIKEHDLTSMQRLKGLAMDDEGHHFFEGAYASKKKQTYIWDGILQKMENAETREEKKKLAPYLISDALHKFPGVQLVNPKKIKKIQNHPALNSLSWKKAIVDESVEQNLQAVRQLQSKIVWEHLFSDTTIRLRRGIVQAFDDIMATRADKIPSIGEIEIVLQQMGMESDFSEELNKLKNSKDPVYQELLVAMKYLKKSQEEQLKLEKEAHQEQLCRVDVLAAASVDT